MWDPDDVCALFAAGGLIQLGDIVGDLLFKVQKHNMTLRGDVAGTIVSMSLIEGLVRQLDPMFDIVGTTIPYFMRFPPPRNDPLAPRPEL